MEDFLEKLEDLELPDSVSNDFGDKIFLTYQQAYQDFISIKEQLNVNTNWKEAYELLSTISLPYKRILKVRKGKTITDKLTLSDIGEIDVGPYIKGIKEAVNVFNTGEPRTGIAVMGRTLEEAIDGYLKIANKQRKIKLAENKRKGMDLDTKINWLGSKKLITPSERFKMLALKWDRNIGSHPKPTYEIDGVNKTSKEIMGIGVKMIERMYLKISDHK